MPWCATCEYMVCMSTLPNVSYHSTTKLAAKVDGCDMFCRATLQLHHRLARGQVRAGGSRNVEPSGAKDSPVVAEVVPRWCTAAMECCRLARELVCE